MTVNVEKLVAGSCGESPRMGDKVHIHYDCYIHDEKSPNACMEWLRTVEDTITLGEEPVMAEWIQQMEFEEGLMTMETGEQAILKFTESGSLKHPGTLSVNAEIILKVQLKSITTDHVGATS